MSRLVYPPLRHETSPKPL